MSKTIKFFRAVVKDVNEDAKTATCIVSTASVDRDGDIVLPESFKKRLKLYKDHAILISSHNYFSLTKQIGQAINVKITEEGLECKFEWFVGKGNPEADWGWFLAQKGIAAFSIGFIPHTWEEGEWDSKAGGYKNGVRRRFTDIELMEVSQVLIPSNRDAVMSERSKLEGETKELAEMAIKTFGWDAPELEVCTKCQKHIAVMKDGTKICDCGETAATTTTEEAKALTKEQIQEIVNAAVTSCLEALLDKALGEKFGPAITKFMKENRPTEDNPEGKTYFDLLLGKGAQQSPDLIPTKEQIAAAFTEAVKT